MDKQIQELSLLMSFGYWWFVWAECSSSIEYEGT